MPKIDQLVEKEQPEPEPETCKKEGGGDKQKVECVSENIRTVEDALRKAEVDSAAWEIERFLINSWEVGAKGPTGKVCVTPLWQVKIWLKAKKGWSVNEMRKLLKADAKSVAPSYRAVRRKKSNPILAELSIYDHHFGKLAWEEETGENYDVKIAEKRYMDAAKDLLGRVGDYKPQRIVYVVGNDFLHVDQGYVGATTKGTQVDCDGRWQKAFRVGLKCAIRVCDLARNIAPVDVIVVAGNHDSEKIFCLGEALAGRYYGVRDVSVCNNASMWQYYRYGVNLIGFNHGDALNDTKIKQLPNTMASDRPEDWAATTCREWHLGHHHCEQENVWYFRGAESVQRVVVRKIPSLCGSDAFHRKHNYASPLAAEAHLYHKETGRWGYLVHTPEKA